MKGLAAASHMTGFQAAFLLHSAQKTVKATEGFEITFRIERPVWMLDCHLKFDDL